MDPSKSKLSDEMKVEAAGKNTFAFTFAPGAVDTIVADGTDQPAMQGTTLSVTVEGPNHWKVVRKKDGKKTVEGIWTLSADGKTLDDAFSSYGPDGSTTTVHYTYQRTAGKSGFLGTWDSVSPKVDSDVTLEIQPYGSAGLSFSSPGLGMALKVNFNEGDSPGRGPDAPPPSNFAGRRVNQHSLELTSKSLTVQIDLSTDLKTLTMSTRPVGENKPQNVFVFERE
ncbi:MAG TPA: hypothetical protein VJ732_10425 [Bryobacteraceae bacterium]|nr:hypothetical protein [Bryobacteraceae bacterium]